VIVQLFNTPPAAPESSQRRIQVPAIGMPARPLSVCSPLAMSGARVPAGTSTRSGVTSTFAPCATAVVPSAPRVTVSESVVPPAVTCRTSSSMRTYSEDVGHAAPL
jgi:hypothetical protein